MLGFARLPDRALATVGRVLDADEGFRSRVAMAADEEEIGRASYLYLTRPEGWEEEVADLAESAQADAASAREEQEERSALRRLRAAQQARDHADRLLQQARAEVARVTAELDEERRARRGAEERADRLAVELDRARAATRAAKDDLQGTHRRLAEVQAERDALRRPGPELDVAGLRDAVATAGGAAALLGDALDAATALLDTVAPADTVGMSTADGAAAPARRPGEGVRLGAVRARGAARRMPAAPRRPVVALPPAVFEDSPGAAEHLIRAPSTAVVVDGYNVTFLAWGDLPVAEQRRRLVDALGELVARTGADVQVVFDGAEGADPLPSGPGRPLVRVSFSPPGVDADEVIIELAGSLPITRPVLVVTSDRRVQEEVRKRGASVISSAQLLAVAGRARPG